MYIGCRLSHGPCRAPAVRQRERECNTPHPVQVARECLCRLYLTNENVSHMTAHRHRHHTTVNVLITCHTTIIHTPIHHHPIPIHTESVPTANIGQLSLAQASYQVKANSSLTHPRNGTGRRTAKNARENTPSIPT